MNYAFLTNIEMPITSFVEFIERNSTLKFSTVERGDSIEYTTWDRSFKLDIRDERKYKTGDRVITQFSSENFELKLNTVLNFTMVTNEEINSSVWGHRAIVLLKLIMRNFSNDCLLYANGYDIPVFMRKDGSLIDLIKNTKWENSALDINLLDIPYTVK